MSYDISLNDPVTKETLHAQSPHQMHGGTYAVGGTTEMWLNITYNYAVWYYKPDVFPLSDLGIRSLYGMSGAESIPVLQHAISALEGMDEDMSDEEKEEYEDRGIAEYWWPTRANAIKPLYQLLAMARMRPDGVWDGD